MIRVGMVGAGGMGWRHAASLSREPDVRVSAVVDRDQLRAEELAKAFGAGVHRRVDEDFLREVDVVYVLTPPRRRVDVIATAAHAGKAVFCEKPLASSLEEGEEIARIVRSSGVPFMVGFCFRFVEPLKRLKQVVDSGRIGRPLSLTRTRMGHLQHQQGNWRIDPAEITGMAVESVSHDIDMLRWLGGDVAAVRGEVLGSDVGLEGYDDNVVATLRFASGAIGALQASWTSPVQFNTLSVVGTLGSAALRGPGMWDWPGLEVATMDGDREVVSFPDDQATDMGWHGETIAFLAALRAGAQVPVDVDDGVAALRLSHEILATSTAGLHDWAQAAPVVP